MKEKSQKQKQKPDSSSNNLITRFMASSLPNVFDNLAEGIHKIKCRNEYNNKKCVMYGIKYKDCECRREYISLKVDLTEYRCLYCNKNCQKKIAENLNKRFFNTKTLSDHDTNKYILLLQKGIYLN